MSQVRFHQERPLSPQLEHHQTVHQSHHLTLRLAFFPPSLLHPFPPLYRLSFLHLFHLLPHLRLFHLLLHPSLRCHPIFRHLFPAMHRLRNQPLQRLPPQRRPPLVQQRHQQVLQQMPRQHILRQMLRQHILRQNPQQRPQQHARRALRAARQHLGLPVRLPALQVALLVVHQHLGLLARLPVVLALDRVVLLQALQAHFLHPPRRHGPPVHLVAAPALLPAARQPLSPPVHLPVVQVKLRPVVPPIPQVHHIPPWRQ
mmetsp:Transcript_7639/g.11683  ORF Transcript_7639/g.11683 Transcript_7639/m.11683 type:complete len:258 (+) Transcript_7639:903-1676(+)